MSLTSFKYRELAESEIRLLVLLPGQGDEEVRCRLDHVSLLAEPKYETISYAWGDPTQKGTIGCEDGLIQVTLNLRSALRHLRHATEERPIWADAVCINQQDLDERSIQVVLMGDIYARGRQVIVWLGEETEDVRTSIECFERLDKFFLENEPGYPDDDPDRWNVFPSGGSSNFSKLHEMEAEYKTPIANFVRRPWFTRRWIIQEVAKAPSATVVCGTRSIPWVQMAEIIWSLHKAGMTLYLSTPDSLEEPHILLDGIQSILLIELVRRDIIKKTGSELLENIISSRRFKCLDPRDVIYSLLGVTCDLDSFNPKPPVSENPSNEPSQLALGIRPDYTSSVAEIYHNFVLCSIINKRSLLPLSSPYLPPDVPHLDLPTWVPDFSRLSDANALMHLRNESALPYKASKGSELKAHFSNGYKVLHVLGRHVDTIKATAPSQEYAITNLELKAQAEAEGWSQDEHQGKAMMHWITNFLRLLNFERDAPDTTWGLTPKVFLEFARTLVCNLTSIGDKPGDDIAIMAAEWLDIASDPGPTIQKYVEAGNQQELIDRLVAWESALGLRCLGWGFCITEGGRMGRCLNNTKLGDKIVLLGGGEVPYLLRHRAEGGYTFVASSYIHNLMDGEGMDIEGVEDEEFAIY